MASEVDDLERELFQLDEQLAILEQERPFSRSPALFRRLYYAIICYNYYL